MHSTCWLLLAIVIVIIIVSLEVKEGSAPHYHTQDFGRGHLSAQGHAELREGEENREGWEARLHSYSPEWGKGLGARHQDLGPWKS